MMMENLTVAKMRIEWIDFIKGIAILELVVYHFGVLPWLVSPVPVFFFLSGIFFSDAKPFGLFVKHKSKALLLPFLFFYVLGLAFNVVGSHIFGIEWGGVKNLCLFFTLIPVFSPNPNPLGVGALWFLPVLFEIYLLYYALRKVAKSSTILLIISLSVMLLSAYLLQHYAMGSLFYILETFQFLVLFVVGHLFRDYWLKSPMPLWIGILGLLFFLTLYLTDSSWNYYLIFVLNKIQMIGIIAFLIILAQRIPESIIKGVINFYGLNSITVLGVHILAMSACKVVLSHILPPSILYYLLMFILIIAICTVCIKIFNRYCPVLVNAK